VNWISSISWRMYDLVRRDCSGDKEQVKPDEIEMKEADRIAKKEEINKFS
jgi:hypothetical protein